MENQLFLGKDFIDYQFIDLLIIGLFMGGREDNKCLLKLLGNFFSSNGKDDQGGLGVGEDREELGNFYCIGEFRDKWSCVLVFGAYLEWNTSFIVFVFCVFDVISFDIFGGKKIRNFRKRYINFMF